MKTLKIEKGDLLFIKVGSEDRPASDEDIERVRSAFEKAEKEPNTILVSHHAVDFVLLKGVWKRPNYPFGKTKVI